MFKKIIIPVMLAIAFAGNASAVTVKGKFNKKTHKIKGAWVIGDIDGHKVLLFDKSFETEAGPDLKILLSKKKLSKLKKTPTFVDPFTLGPLQSVSGQQHYVLPKSINIEDYKSIVIHSEETNILWGGFSVPIEGFVDDIDDIYRVLENNEGAIRVGL